MSNEIKTNVFKERLKELMHNKYITKAQFCRDIDISKPTLDKWLNTDNDILPTLTNTLLIAEKYNISIDWLSGNKVKQEDKQEDEDIVRKIFEAIIFLDEHLDIEINKDIDIASQGFNVFTDTRTNVKFTQIGIYYFVQEYEKIQKIVNDPAYADYKEGMLNKLFEKFADFYYSKEYKCISLAGNLDFDYDYSKEELIISENKSKGTVIPNIDEFEAPF